VGKLKKLVAKYIYGYDSDLLEAVVGTALREQGKTIATAESCTGGYLAHLITSIAGSSDYFKGGVIPYDNDLKISQLGVRSNILQDHGAVSAETVVEMAKKVREKFGTDIGVASSGIAGPGGGSAQKPVGTIWIAYADREKTAPYELKIGFGREKNIKFTSQAILNLVRRYLNGDLD